MDTLVGTKRSNGNMKGVFVIHFKGPQSQYAIGWWTKEDLLALLVSALKL